MRIFWPVYLLVALAGVVLTWIMAPSFRDSVPEEMRASWSSGVASLKGVDIDGLERAKADREQSVREAARAEEAAALAAAGRRSEPQRPAVAPRRRAARQASSSVGLGQRVVQARDPAAPADDVAEAVPATPPPRPAQPSRQEQEQYDPLPSTRGIAHTDYKEAEGGILNAVTAYRSLSDGEEAGKAAAGSVFVVEQRQPAAGGGVEFIGNFRNHPLDEPVIIPAAKLYCFTGSYDSLTPRQKSALAGYYRLRAQSEQLKRDMMKEAGARSPYFAKAVEAKAKWDGMVKLTEELEAQLRTDKRANASQIRDKLARMKGEMSVLQGKVKELSAKHKEWKAKNPSAAADPEEDPRLQKLRAEMQSYARIIPGLAF